jgi:hypothetical protein
MEVKISTGEVICPHPDKEKLGEGRNKKFILEVMIY